MSVFIYDISIYHLREGISVYIVKGNNNIKYVAYGICGKEDNKTRIDGIYICREKRRRATTQDKTHIEIRNSTSAVYNIR